MTRPTLYTVHGFAVIVLLLLVLFAGAKTGYVTQLLLDRDALAQEIADNASTMSALSDRLIRLTEWATITGTASWYGHFEDGLTTANGETFDRTKVTIAVPWPLPMNRFYAVTRADTFKSVLAWANDRIPRQWGRIVDLSEAAARELGMIERGLAPVILGPEM